MALGDSAKVVVACLVLTGASAACGSSFTAESSGGDGASGGSSASGGVDGASQRVCDRDMDCLVAANFADACFSPSCSLPVGASRSSVESDPCLVPWELRFSYSGVPAGCTVLGNGVPCLASCAVAPACVEARCDGVRCDVVLGYDDQECEGVSGGSGGLGVGGSSSGSGGRGGSGGTGGEPSCAELDAAREALLEEARRCDLDSGINDCSGDTTILDACGCPTVISDFSDEANEAQEAYNRWVNAGCEPEACLGECFVAPVGSCQAHEDGARCTWGN